MTVISTRTPMCTDLVEAYLAGDPDAIEIIEVAVDVVRTVAVIRNVDDTDIDHDVDELRNDCDQACDYLFEVFARAEDAALIGPHEL